MRLKKSNFTIRVGIFLLFIFPLKSFSQDFSGVWVGYMYNDTTQQTIHYELAINDVNGKTSGFSHTTFIIDGVKNIGVKEVKVRAKKDKVYVEDEKFVYDNYTEPAAKGVKMFSFLTLSNNDSAEVLSGIWRTNATRKYNPLTGSIFLEKKRKVEPQQTIIVKKLIDLGLGNQLAFLPPNVNETSIANPELAKAQKMGVDSINKAEQQIAFAKAQKARADSIKKVEEQIAIVKAEKAREDSIKKAEQQTAIAKAQKVREDSIKKVEQQIAIAKAEKAREDSIKKVEQQIAIAKAENARKDSIKKVEQQIAIAKAEKAREDSIKKVEQQIAIAKAEKARKDSIKKVEEQITIAKAEKAREDSIKKVEEQNAIAKAEKAKEDSIKKVEEQIAIAKAQKAKVDSIKQAEQQMAFAKAQKIRQDSIKKVQEQIEIARAQKAKEDSIKKAKQQMAIAKSEKAGNDSLKQVEELNAIAKANEAKEGLEKQKQAQQQVVKTAKENPPAAAEISKRKLETIRTVEIEQDSLVLTLYDNGAVDGDTVSVLVNGQVVMPRVGLLASAISKTIHLTPEMGDSISVVMYAENLGSIPPNTGLLVIHDGARIYEIRFSGDLKKNSKIILVRKKKT
ncbi:MAG: hypothetical protein ACTHK8_17720 [Ginsengibacter sp.]